MLVMYIDGINLTRSHESLFINTRYEDLQLTSFRKHIRIIKRTRQCVSIRRNSYARLVLSETLFVGGLKRWKTIPWQFVVEGYLKWLPRFSLDICKFRVECGLLSLSTRCMGGSRRVRVSIIHIYMRKKCPLPVAAHDDGEREKICPLDSKRSFTSPVNGRRRQRDSQHEALVAIHWLFLWDLARSTGLFEAHLTGSAAHSYMLCVYTSRKSLGADPLALFLFFLSTLVLCHPTRAHNALKKLNECRRRTWVAACFFFSRASSATFTMYANIILEKRQWSDLQKRFSKKKKKC